MPIVKFSNPEVSDNKGSCNKLVNYLEKENDNPNIPIKDKQFFYDREREFVQAIEVEDRIDNNKKKLRKDQAKFYMLTINYSEKEIEHMRKMAHDTGNDFSELTRSFTRRVMVEYRKNFQLEDLKDDEVLWFAKDEFNRYKKGYDLSGTKGKELNSKDGENYHTHLIISRLRDGQSRAISPMTNHRKVSKGGPVNQQFSRTDFKENVEKAFDAAFNYSRPYQDKYVYLNAMKNGTPSEKHTQEQKRMQWKKQALLQKSMRSIQRSIDQDAFEAELEQKRKYGLNI